MDILTVQKLSGKFSRTASPLSWLSPTKQDDAVNIIEMYNLIPIFKYKILCQNYFVKFWTCRISIKVQAGR